ncbi:MAG: hypothetical protein IRZ28_21235 [Steroidobacteraceae bacterium]|nr:hypothetical protein [Steroidobacteraceae bacterium]
MARVHYPHETKIKLAAAAFAILTAAIAGIASAGLREKAPKDVDLTALWKINSELSDDPQKVIARARTEENAANRGSSSPSGGRSTSGTGDVFGGVVFGGVIFGGGQGGASGSADRPANDPPPMESTRVPLDAFLATREQFEIVQSPDAMTIRNDEETSTCKPGETQRVQLQGGELVDQKCGWDGDAFVIELVSPDGVKRTKRYELRDKGKQLHVLTTVKGGSGHLANLRIKRVYERLVAF